MTSDVPALPGSTTASPSELTFHYLKSTQFRVIYVDGAVAAVTPGLLIHLALFNERPPIPQQVTHAVRDGQIQEEMKERTVIRGGIIRELESDVFLSLESAMAIRDLLDRTIEQLTKIREIARVLPAAGT